MFSGIFLALAAMSKKHKEREILSNKDHESFKQQNKS